MIKVVFTDIDDTLLDFTECSRIAVKASCRKYGLSFSSKLFDRFMRITSRMWKDIENGSITREVLIKTRWNTVFSELGIDFDGELFEKSFRSDFYDTGEKVEGSDELLGYLSQKYTICAASNAPYDQQLHRLKIAGLHGYFDYVFTSEKIGYTKPDPRFFHACIEELKNIEPHQIIMIGDSLRADIAGAAACGITTCYFKRVNDAEATDVKADYTVTSLLQIKDLL